MPCATDLQLFGKKEKKGKQTNKQINKEMDEDRNNIQLEDSPHQTIHMNNSSSSSSNSNGSGTMLDAEASQPARWNDQLKGVLKKNLRLYTHKKSLWASVIILPPVLMLVVFFYTKLIMAFEKPVSAYRSPITNYPAVLLPKFSFTTSAAACTQQKTPCILAVSPDTLETRALASKVRETLYDDQTGRMPPLFFYENSTALLTAMNTEGERFFGGISFHDGDVKNGSYTLYMKSSLLPQDAYESRPNIYNGGMYSLSNASLYFSSGFATLQSALDLSTLHNGPGAEDLNVTLRSKVLPGWEKNAIAPTLSMLICLMVLVSYSPLMTNGATLVTNENVSKTRQYLFTLGLKRWVYWLSWVLTLFVPSIIIALLWVLCGLVGSTLSIGGAVYMSFYYAFFSLSIIMVVLIVQCVVKTVMWSTAISSAFLVLPPVIARCFQL